MRTNWIKATAALAVAGLVAACAEGSLRPERTHNRDDDSGDKDQGVSSSSAGQSGSAGIGAGAGGSGGTGEGGMGENTGGAAGEGEGGGSGLCGNGALDPSESCDGSEFGGKTCESLGLGGGELQCNQFCKIVAFKCTPSETCGDGQDNDKDLLIDCQDDECAMVPACLDSCASPKVVASGLQSGETTGRPDVNKASCSPSTGPELIYELVASMTGDLSFTLSSASEMSVSVRTTCSDAAAEIACVHKINGEPAKTLTVPVTQGTTYYVMIESTGEAQVGWFTLLIETPAP